MTLKHFLKRPNRSKNKIRKITVEVPKWSEKCLFFYMFYAISQPFLKISTWNFVHIFKRHYPLTYPAPHWGIFITRPTGGGLFRAPPLISETTGPILKIQTAFERPGKTVEGKQILLTSGSRVTSQVRSKSKCSTFRAWWHRRAKLRC